MKIETENAWNGKYVEFRYHVAPAVKITLNDGLLILDPSNSPTPMLKAEYHQFFSGMTGYVTCDAITYGILDQCLNPIEREEEFLEIQKWFWATTT